MGNVPGILKFRSRNHGQAPDIVVGFADRRAAGINHLHAIHVEPVAVGPGTQRPQGHLPDAFGVLGHFRALAIAGDVAAGKAYGFRLGRQDPEGDVSVRGNFGRNHLRALRASWLRDGLGCHDP